MGQLAALQILNLRDNNLTALPETLGQLPGLARLNLAACGRLKALPSQLPPLTTLSVGAAEDGKGVLTELPGCVTALASLTTVHVWDAGLTRLPESLGQLARLDRGLQVLDGAARVAGPAGYAYYAGHATMRTADSAARVTGPADRPGDAGPERVHGPGGAARVARPADQAEAAGLN